MAMHDELPVPRTAAADEVMRVALRYLDRGQRVVVATVIERRGSAPCTPGQKLALLGEQAAIGTVGGGAVEYRVLEAMRDAVRDGAMAPKMRTFSLGASIGMCCGGEVQVLIEPLVPALSVLLVGGGHIGATLAPMLTSLGFRVVLCDGREEVLTPERIVVQDRLQVLCADHDDPEVGQALTGDKAHTAALVMTHDHQLDRQVIGWCLGRGFAFVGGVGSRAKLARTKTWLAARGADVADIERIRMPVGLDIGARAPGEIAVAISGELIEWRAAVLGTVRAKGSSRAAQPATAQVVEAD